MAETSPMKNCSEAKKETPRPRGWVSAAVAAVMVALLVALLIMVRVNGYVSLFGKSLERFVEDEAGLWLDSGAMFGPDGDGFIRINIATQRAYLAEALKKLTDAIARRGF